MCASLSWFCVFFKQKTAYEMRISDWSSDVCSSDLIKAGFQAMNDRQRLAEPAAFHFQIAVGDGDARLPQAREQLVIKQLDQPVGAGLFRPCAAVDRGIALPCALRRHHIHIKSLVL